MTKLLGPLVVLFAWLPLSSASVFTQTEMKAAAVRDHLRAVRTTLRDNTDANRTLTSQTVEAFRGEPDWAKAAEAYYGLRPFLLARASALEVRLDRALAANSIEKEDQAGGAVDAVLKDAEVLRSDFTLYLRLPSVARGPQRRAAQATMRLLSQTGKYPVALAFFDSRMDDRTPFAPLPPPAALMIRRP